MIGPIIDQLATDLDGQAKIGKVNVDEARDLAVKYNVRSIPLLLFFKNGEVKDQIVGASVTKDQLKAKLMALAWSATQFTQAGPGNPGRSFFVSASNFRGHPAE